MPKAASGIAAVLYANAQNRLPLIVPRVRREERDGVSSNAQVARDDREVRCFDRHVGAGSQCDAEVGLRQRRRVVDAVADHGDASALGLEPDDLSCFAFGQHVGDHRGRRRPQRRPFEQCGRCHPSAASPSARGRGTPPPPRATSASLCRPRRVRARRCRHDQRTRRCCQRVRQPPRLVRRRVELFRTADDDPHGPRRRRPPRQHRSQAGSTKPSIWSGSSPRADASAAIACAIGCSDRASTAPARPSSTSASPAVTPTTASGATTSTSDMRPSVTVPVLSSTIVSIRRVSSSTSPPLMITPSCAARPVPTMMPSGVARPSAHGQAMISTATAAVNASFGSPTIASHATA